VKGDGGTLTRGHRQAIKSWPLCKQHGLVCSAAAMPTGWLPLFSQSHASFLTSGTKKPSDVLSSHRRNVNKMKYYILHLGMLFGCDMSYVLTCCTVLFCKSFRIIVNAAFL